MKLIEVSVFLAVLLICSVCYLLVWVFLNADPVVEHEDGVFLINPEEFTRHLRRDEVRSDEITLALVICGNSSERISQAITMLKTVILVGQPNMKLRVVSFVDRDARPLFTKQIKHLRLQGEALESRVSIEIKSTWFPKDTFSDWNHLYSLCSTQRLFFPSLLPSTDALIYLDTDILVLEDLGVLWNQFGAMNESQIFGMSAENELPGNGWYNTKAKFPYYGQRGVNAGVLLMNLTRMRNAHFEHRANDIFKEYRHKLQWGDQDILNIYLHFHPEYLHVLPCEWNYRMDHCDCEFGGGACNCKAAEIKGASLFHGNKGAFRTTSKYKFAQEFYQVFNKSDLLQDSTRDLIDGLVKALSLTRSSANVKCKRLKSILMRKIWERFEDNEHEPFLDFSSGSR